MSAHTEAFELDVPEDAIVVSRVAVVLYMDAEGEDRYALSLPANTNLSTILGMLEMAKLQAAIETGTIAPGWLEDDDD